MTTDTSTSTYYTAPSQVAFLHTATRRFSNIAHTKQESSRIMSGQRSSHKKREQTVQFEESETCQILFRSKLEQSAGKTITERKRAGSVAPLNCQAEMQKLDAKVLPEDEDSIFEPSLDQDNAESLESDLSFSSPEIELTKPKVQKIKKQKIPPNNQQFQSFVGYMPYPQYPCMPLMYYPIYQPVMVPSYPASFVYPYPTVVPPTAPPPPQEEKSRKARPVEKKVVANEFKEMDKQDVEKVQPEEVLKENTKSAQKQPEAILEESQVKDIPKVLENAKSDTLLNFNTNAETKSLAEAFKERKRSLVEHVPKKDSGKNALKPAEPPVLLNFDMNVGPKSLAEAFKERKMSLVERVPKKESGKVDKVKPRTKEEILQQRKEMMKSKVKKRNTAQSMDPVDKTENTLLVTLNKEPMKGPKPELIERLAAGKKPEISKEAMRKLAKKNYQLLPEVVKKREEEKKKQENLERIRLARLNEKKRIKLVKPKKV